MPTAPDNHDAHDYAERIRAVAALASGTPGGRRQKASGFADNSSSLMKNILPLLTALLLTPLAALNAETTSSPIPPTRFTQIRAISPAPPIRTAAESLRDFLKSRGVEVPMVTAAGTKEPSAAGTILLGTTADTPTLAAWAKEGRLSVTASEQAGDAYEIVVLDGVIAVNGANARAVLYGAFELEDVIALCQCRSALRT